MFIILLLVSRYFHAVTEQAHENETNLIVICIKMLIRFNHSLTGGPGMLFQIIPAHFLTPGYEVTCD